MRLVFLALVCGSATIATASSSSSLLDVHPDGKQLLVANTDGGTVTLVDLATRKALRELPVGDHPEAVAWIGAGPLAIATVYRDDKVVLIDTVADKVVAAMNCAAEPYGVVTTKDGKRAFVSHDYPGLVSEIDLEAHKVVRTIPSGEWSRGIALTPDE